MFYTLLAAPPDTSKYMIMGYTVIFVVLTLYLLSLGVRYRNTRRDLEMLEELHRKS